MGIKIFTMSDGRFQFFYFFGFVSFCSNDKSRRILNLLEVVILELQVVILELYFFYDLKWNCNY